ncbi:MAG: asparagine synthetase B [Saprospiraceae bacterium]|nr:MAG: asparagine synthetase B [Saprospiraceae bacterium]
MCGIYGNTKIIPAELVEKKLARVRFRGPDFSHWHNYNNKVIFGHNRLAIVDLDARSNQPFDYQHVAIVYNGEVYNFKEIRTELEQQGFRFTTTSDTEVICAAYIAYGKQCIEHFNGMFAFVIYDKKENILFGARDRTGQKPFYYSLRNQHFEFASQPSQIAIGTSPELDERAIAQFLKWDYISEPKSIYRDVSKLRAGYSFSYDLQHKTFADHKYWDISTENQFSSMSFPEAKSTLHHLLIDSVKKRMVADVPVGIFLSGGVDSSLIAALAQASRDAPVRTFCVKFEEETFDESKYARQVANHLKTDHTEIHCNYQEGIEMIEDLYKYFDEPFANASALPSLLLAKYTRQHVTVALSGDAGDENFLGYKRYDKILDRSKIFNVPRGIRQLIALGYSLSPNRNLRYARPKGIMARDVNDLYYQKTATMDDEWITNRTLGDNKEYFHYLSSQKPLLERISDFDIKTYLIEDVNTKADRSTMAYSLEGRSPLLDYRIVEFARSLPTDFKYYQGNKKHILKEVLYEYIPKEIFDRKKAGFAMPLRLWFRGKLKNYVLDLLTAENLREIPNINIQKVLKMSRLHIEGKENNYEMIWRLLVLINWMRNN